MPSPASSPVPCLVGPTASGKTAVGVELARRSDGEVICCDAFTVYRGLRILTAAPAAPEDVPHHLVGVIDVRETYSAARFLADADRVVAEIRGRGRAPWIVGGTALYLRAWIQGFGAPVPRDEAFREAMRAKVEAEGAAALHAELVLVDPERAAALHQNDVRRVVRALEIARATSRPASEQRAEWDAPPRVGARVVCLRRSADDLDRRIDLRTRRMFEEGVVEEARALLARPLSAEARKVLGLGTLEALLRGEIGRTHAEAEIAQKTRRLARKQMTFFRSFRGIRFIDIGADDDDATIATAVANVLDAAE